MCSTGQSALMEAYGMKMPNLLPYFQYLPSTSQLSAMDFQRFQMLNYNPRMQLGIRGYPSNLNMLPYDGHLIDSYTQACLYKRDLREEYIQVEPKPSHSYIALISMAILDSKDMKLVLGDIYQWILDNFSYFRSRGTGWRNSIRHNLSLNECFVKCARSANGKGHYWAIHEANVQDFKIGDFRRRRAQRKVRRYMGLAFPGEDEDDSPCSSPTPAPNWAGRSFEERNTSPSENSEIENNRKMTKVGPSGSVGSHESNEQSDISLECDDLKEEEKEPDMVPFMNPAPVSNSQRPMMSQPTKKRRFDIESLLAPDIKRTCVDSSSEVTAENKMQWTQFWSMCHQHQQFKPCDLRVMS